MWMLIFIGAGLITALVHLCIIGFDSSVTICSTILLHQFVVTTGFTGLVGFIMNVCFAEPTAKDLGWPGGPFQLKYGFSQLGICVMGVLSIWFRGTFWVGMLVTLYIYGLSGLWTRIVELKESGKKDPIEIANMIVDIFYHVVLTVLSVYIPGVWHIG